MKLCESVFPFLQAELGNLLKPLSNLIQQVQNFREANRTSPLFNHLSAVSETVPGFFWVTVVSRCLCLLLLLLLLCCHVCVTGGMQINLCSGQKQAVW